MAHRADALTEQQWELLKWIGDGCPAGVMSDDSHRISAAALSRRGLVRITGRGPTWTAQLAKAGREAIARSKSDDAPAPRQANVSVTQQLVDDVIAAGGSLRVPQHQPWEKGRIDFRRRAELAQSYGKVPPGKALIVSDSTADWLQIDLVDAFGGHASALQPVQVPERVGKHHPLVRQFRDRSPQHEVSRAALPRVLRILHALVQEAENRGYKVALVEGRDARRGRDAWSGPKQGHVLITVGGDTEAIRVHEEGLPSRTYWEQNHQRWDGRSMSLPPLTEYEAGATGRLVLSIVSGWTRRGRQASWADRQSWRLEDKLPELLREVEVRAAEAEERRQEAARREQQRVREWEAAMENARARFAEHLRADALTSQVERWRTVAGIRAYCDAIEERYPGGESTEWVAWARRYADGLDPLREPPAPPAVPEDVRPEQLQPFLSGWSAYGPEHHRGWR
jgi:hypothetical protein